MWECLLLTQRPTSSKWAAAPWLAFAPWFRQKVHVFVHALQVLSLSDMLAQAHQAGGSSSSTDGPQEKEFAPAAATATDTSMSLQDLRKSSSATATTLPAAGAPDGAGGSALNLEAAAAESVTTTTSSGNRQAGKLSSSTIRLQQLKQQRQNQVQQKCTADTTLGSAAVPHSMEGAAPAAAAGAAGATALGGQGVEQLLVQGDLTCDVNRWDLLQRGVGRNV